MTVTLTATDNLSGVAATFFRLDEEAAAGGTTGIAGEGMHSLEDWSIDKAGNGEPTGASRSR